MSFILFENKSLVKKRTIGPYLYSLRVVPNMLETKFEFICHVLELENQSLSGKKLSV